MTQIKVTCPDCKKQITVQIRTIDSLRAENERLKAEILRLKRLDSDQDFGSYFKDFIKNHR